MRFKVEIWCIGHGHYRGRALVGTLAIKGMTEVLNLFEHFVPTVECPKHGKMFLIPSLKVGQPMISICTKCGVENEREDKNNRMTTCDSCRAVYPSHETTIKEEMREVAVEIEKHRGWIIRLQLHLTNLELSLRPVMPVAKPVWRRLDVSVSCHVCGKATMWT